MAGFKNVSTFVNSDLNGQGTFATFRKVASQNPGAMVWFDMSLYPGNPSPQYYAASPLVSVILSQSTDGGMYHGGAVSPAKKFLKKIGIISAANALPLRFILLDYLLFYPFIDEGTTDTQTLTNSVSLPRYTNGEGVKIMPVSVAAGVGGQSFFCSYTNQDGVSGRTTPSVVQSTTQSVGSIISSDRAVNLTCGPFLTLQSGDTGVRSIESVTMNRTDVGLFTLVLVKPIYQFSAIETTAAVEVECFKDFSNCPEIKDNAYLNLIASANVPQTIQYNGYIETIWN